MINLQLPDWPLLCEMYFSLLSKTSQSFGQQWHQMWMITAAPWPRELLQAQDILSGAFSGLGIQLLHDWKVAASLWRIGWSQIVSLLRLALGLFRVWRGNPFYLFTPSICFTIFSIEHKKIVEDIGMVLNALKFTDDDLVFDWGFCTGWFDYCSIALGKICLICIGLSNHAEREKCQGQQVILHKVS
jgi:hypothetical protein